MFEDPMPPADSDDGPEDQVDAAESSAEQRDSGESAAEVAAGADPEVSGDPPGSRGPRLVRWVILLFVVSLATVEISSPLCSGYSLGAIESAFSNQSKSGLTLESARSHAVGLVTTSFRDESSQLSNKTGVRYAVFRWPSLFRDHSFEVEVEPGKDGKTIVRSQPYVRVTSNYEVVQPIAKPLSLAEQLQMLDFETDSVGTHRVERWQVERAVKNKKSDVIPETVVLPTLLEFFDKADKNQDGVVTAGEMGDPGGIEPAAAGGGGRKGGRGGPGGGRKSSGKKTAEGAAETGLGRMAQFDKDKDGKISKAESEDTFLANFFDRLDGDSDGFVTVEEVAASRARRKNRGGGSRGGSGERKGRPEKKADGKPDQPERPKRPKGDKGS
jgi:hypothetical protein